MKQGPCHRPAKQPCWSSSLGGEIAIGHAADSQGCLLLNKGRLRHCYWGRRSCVLHATPRRAHTHKASLSRATWQLIISARKGRDYRGTQTRTATTKITGIIREVAAIFTSACCTFVCLGPTCPFHAPDETACFASSQLQSKAQSQVGRKEWRSATFKGPGSLQEVPGGPRDPLPGVFQEKKPQACDLSQKTFF